MIEVKGLYLKGIQCNVEEPVDIEDIISGNFKDEKGREFENKYLSNYHFTIMGYDEDFEENIEIGVIDCKLIEIKKLIEDNYSSVDFLLECSCVSETMEDISLIIKKNFMNINQENILFIENILIKPEYRNKGFGSLSIIMLETAIKRQFNKNLWQIIVDDYKEDHKGVPETNEEKIIFRDYCAKKILITTFFKILGFNETGDSNYLSFNTEFDMCEKYRINKEERKIKKSYY